MAKQSVVTYKMKHRITYLLHEGEPGIDPSTVQVTPDSVTSGPTRAVQEWRVTVGLLDLPNEVGHYGDVFVSWD